MKPFSLYLAIFALIVCSVYGLSNGGAQAIMNSNPLTKSFVAPSVTQSKSSDQGNLNRVLGGVGVKVTFTDI